MVEICAIPTKPLCHNGSRLDGLITPTLTAAGSNPVGRTKKSAKSYDFADFFLSVKEPVSA